MKAKIERELLLFSSVLREFMSMTHIAAQQVSNSSAGLEEKQRGVPVFIKCTDRNVHGI